MPPPPQRHQQARLTSSFRASKGGAAKTKQKSIESKKPQSKNQKLTETPTEPVAAEEEEPHSDLDVNAPKLKKIVKSIESQRIAKPVHQENVSPAEKILLNFDLSSQYGPCAGLSRLERWNRAERLGLNPPKVVLEMLQTKQATTDPAYKESFLYDRGI